MHRQSCPGENQRWRAEWGRVRSTKEERCGAVGGRGRGDRKGVWVGGGLVIIVFSNSFFKHGGMGLEGLPVSSCAVVKVKASPPPPPALGSQPQTPEAPSS